MDIDELCHVLQRGARLWIRNTAPPYDRVPHLGLVHLLKELVERAAHNRPGKRSDPRCGPVGGVQPCIEDREIAEGAVWRPHSEVDNHVYGIRWLLGRNLRV